ncbi:hypothetical protein SPICUR_05565 [Spiribacter curvatus]|uniref:Uncharacterized protein n=1 Tax=Spiribacter curvatus TaxID=1335757 RepID=U5T7B5_9GAMM|nr:hypothetical protein SPICUR_05565 [Spiribacter curvatus]
MTDFDHCHNQRTISNFIKDPIYTLPDPIPMLTGELLTPWRSGFIA